MTDEKIYQVRDQLRQLVLARIVHQPLARICTDVLGQSQFLRAAGGSKHHHVYSGGLIEHTLQVTQVALSLGRLLEADQQVLAIAALWHDYGKIFDYQIAEDGRVTDTPHRKLINHLSRSAIEFMLACQAILHYEDLKEAVLHCILSHHGCQEWGSPVEPQTLEAHILHYADMLSSRFPSTKEKENDRY